LNDEPALLVCDYGKVKRPRIPFPYYQEAWTGIEYLVAAQFIHAGMLREGLAAIENVRRRFDGERRNPWDEPECGHHYARAMSAWSSVVEWSGFQYHAADKRVALEPKSTAQPFRSFWSSGLGWGVFSVAANRAEVEVREGTLPVRSVRLAKRVASVRLAGAVVAHRQQDEGNAVLAEDVVLKPGISLVLAY
jgi:hypothetical protein